jgi:hypothetical protein
MKRRPAKAGDVLGGPHESKNSRGPSRTLAVPNPDALDRGPLPSSICCGSCASATPQEELVTPGERGALRRRLRRIVRELGGVGTATQVTGIPYADVLAAVGYYGRPTDEQLRRLSLRLMVSTYNVAPPSLSWCCEGGRS